MLGRAQLGSYQDDCEGIHPNTIAKYYGTDGHSERYLGETGAGHPSDERVGDLANRLHEHQSRNVKHDAITVPSHANPFTSNSGAQRTFCSVLADVVRHNVIPSSYGVLPEEWTDGLYPDTEQLIVGRKRKPITLLLADPIWKAQAIQWVQGLSVLSQFQE